MCFGRYILGFDEKFSGRKFLKHICAFVGVFRVVVPDGGDAIDPIGEEQISVRVDEPPTIVDLFCPEKARRFYSFVQIASITRIVEIFCFIDFGFFLQPFFLKLFFGVNFSFIVAQVPLTELVESGLIL